MNRLFVTLALAASSVLGCAPSPGESTRVLASATPQASTNREERVIARLRTRDEVLTITSTSAGPRYAVATPEGAPLAEGLTVEQLGATHPTLGNLVRDATAGAILDARYDAAHDVRRAKEVRQ